MSEGAQPRLLLASTSPQRRAILTQLGIPFRAVAPAYDEGPLALAPRALVEAHSQGKARSVGRATGELALGVDTVVVVDGEVLGKPADEAAATAMLERLAGREHSVCSGLTLLSEEGDETASDETLVRFHPLDGAAIARSVAHGEWRGRAGAYAIQERGALLVAGITGDYLNVVGLPVALLVRMLARRGFHGDLR